MNQDTLGLLLELLITIICLTLFLLLSGKLKAKNTKINQFINNINQSKSPLIKYMTLILGILMLINFLLHLVALINN